MGPELGLPEIVFFGVMGILFAAIAIFMLVMLLRDGNIQHPMIYAIILLGIFAWLMLSAVYRSMTEPKEEALKIEKRYEYVQRL